MPLVYERGDNKNPKEGLDYLMRREGDEGREERCETASSRVSSKGIQELSALEADTFVHRLGHFHLETDSAYRDRRA